ncbi:MAG: PQQ-binding-like beta-propeller repeat protein [Candidatus Altiarchaeota archaeon]
MKSKIILAVILIFSQIVLAQSIIESFNLLWSKELDPIASVDFDGESFVAGFKDGSVHVFDSAGKQRWVFDGEEGISSIRASNGRIAAATDSGKLLVFDEAGVVSWERMLDGKVGFPRALFFDKDFLCVGTMQDRVYLFRSNGEFLWDTEVESYILAVGIVEDKVVVISDKKLVIFDMVGEELSSYRFSSYALFADIGGGEIAVSLGDDSLILFDTNGKVKWGFELAQPIGAVSIGKNEVSFGSKNHHIYIIDFNGTQILDATLDSPVTNIFLKEDLILASTLAQRLYLLDESGKILWKKSDTGALAGIGFNKPFLFLGSREGQLALYKLVERNIRLSYIQGALLFLSLLVVFSLLVYSWRV